MYPEPHVIHELVRRIVEVAQPRRIILFGSAARGEMRPHSDLDVLVIVAEQTPRRQTVQRIYRNLIGFGHGADIVVATERDLHQYGDNFSLVYYPAMREGREIYAT
jgi:predicted nucleotidyltransferase